MSGRRFNFRAEKAVEEFVDKCCGEKPQKSDYQIKNLIGSDSRLAGETVERVKRKILTLLRSNKNKTVQVTTTTPSVPVPPWGGNFSYQGQDIEIINSCPIDNLLTTFHLLFSTDSDFLEAFEKLPYEGAKTLLAVHNMFSNQQWTTGKLIWLANPNQPQN